MKVWKRILSGVFWLLIAALMAAPLVLIWQISQKEMEAYAAPTAPVLRETSIGGIAVAYRTDVQEFVTLSGSVSSSTYSYMELEQENVGAIRWYVSIGDEVQEGQTIGSCFGEPVTAVATGTLVGMDTASSDPYLRIQLYTPVELHCTVNDRVLSVLKRAEELMTEEGFSLSLLYASKQKDANGMTQVRLALNTDRYTYGQQITGLDVYTGMVYGKVLVLPSECVYQKKNGSPDQWYVRQVTEEGIFIREIQVEISYDNGDTVCVTNVEEGTYYDTGYKAISGG